MSEWITDRLPTEEDAPAHRVWTMHQGCVEIWHYKAISSGEPWQPIPRPAPYVKPKRWTFRKSRFECYDNWLVFRDGQLIHSLAAGLSHDDALRIIDIYNEVMP